NKGTKFLSESELKLPKSLKDMLLKLVKKVNWDKEKRTKIQTVGIIHADNPKRYICRLQRGELMEVPDNEENFPSILTILASVLNIKLSQTENAELKNEIAKLKRAVKNIEKQNRIDTNDLKSSEYSTPLPNKSCSNGENAQIKNSSTHHEADKSMTSTDLVVNTISDASNLSETCSRKSKSLEDKEIDVFLDSENKKRVSNEIRQRNKEKKLLRSNEVSISQDQDLSLINQDTSTESEKTITSSSLCDAKTVTKYHDLNNSDTSSEMLESDDQIVEGLIQEITYPGSLQSLSDLFDKAIKLDQKQILCWYYYSLEFENKMTSKTMTKCHDQTNSE
ncbi:6524_t:CDS:2, partial [Diversispora eburnea]